MTSLAIALGVIAVLFVRAKSDHGQVITEPLRPQADASASTPSREQTSPRPAVSPSKPQLAPSVGRIAVDHATTPPALMAEAYARAEKPIDILVTAPIQVANGSTFEVSVGVPPGAPVRSARFRVNYDAESFEVLDIVDATGTALTVVPFGDGSVELDFDTDQGAIQAPAVRFLARVDAPRLVEITVTASAYDDAGKALAMAPAARYPIMLVP